MIEPCRIQLSRAKGWKMPPNTVKVSRPSVWGNPFGPHQVGIVFPWTMDGAPIVHLREPASLGRCIDLYTAYLRLYVECVPTLLVPLRGKNLACWCALDKPCHADVLLRLAPCRFEDDVILPPRAKGEYGVRFPQRRH